MSRDSDPFWTLISLAIAFFFITIVLPILAGTVGVMYAINTVTYELLPKAELPRTRSGGFVVTTGNYKNWHTMARIETSNSQNATLSGKFVVRAFPEVNTTCYRIKNCENYDSEFVRLNYKMANVYLITQEDDPLFTQALSRLKSSVDKYNSQLKDNFDLNVSFSNSNEFSGIEDQFKILEEMNIYSSKENKQKVAHNNVVQFAQNNCRNNARGCGVNAKLNYDYSVFGGPDFIISR
jgi:hypothetical protein